MAATWREERPEAMTAASHSAERPSRSMVTTFSALSSSSEARIRSSSALGGVRFFAGAGAAFFTGFFAAWGAVLRADFLGEDFATFFDEGFALAVCFARGFFFAAFRAEIL